MITFCIMTFDRSSLLRECLACIKRHCPVDYSVKLLVMGQVNKELSEIIAGHPDDLEVLILPHSDWRGVGGGRQLLARLATSPFTMMIDDDLYLTHNSIGPALDVFRVCSEIGAVSMPHYDTQGRMISAGGKKAMIVDGVLTMVTPQIDPALEWIQVEQLAGSAFIYRTEMRRIFSWDDSMGYFEDYDKSMQIWMGGRWKQAIVPMGRVIHDRSWVVDNPKYKKRRFDGLAIRRAYRLFRKKWGVRLDLRSHVTYELVYPAFTLTNISWLPSGLARFIAIRSIKRLDSRMNKSASRP
jgi:GT2 family glycosyltransferase